MYQLALAPCITIWITDVYACRQTEQLCFVVLTQRLWILAVAHLASIKEDYPFTFLDGFRTS